MATKTENAGINLYINTKGAEASMKNLKDDARKLRNELNNLSESDPRFNQLATQLQKVNGRMEDLNMKVKGTSKAWEFMKNQVVQFGVLAAGFLGFQMLIGQIDNLVRSNYKLADSLADIRKTTGLTEKEVMELNKELGKINTRTATKELRDMAVVAGQLGYSSKKDVLEFVKAMDLLNVALGDEFTGGAEQLAKEFGGLGRNFQEFKDKNPAETIMYLGNAINELSASGAATGPVMTDFANRIGGIGGALGLTAGQTLGLSATLQELNITAERGGTAIGKILQKMTTNVSEFAQIAGLPVQKFSNLLNNDMYSAFIKVVEGAKKGGASATALARVLKDAELQGSGASEVFLKLGNNTDLLSKRVDMANKSLKDTNSITNEFNVKNNNFAANVDKIGKAIAGAFTNSAVMGGLNSLVAGIANLVTPTENAAEATRKEAFELNKAATSIYSMAVGTDARKKAIQELQEKYPQYLGNLNAEKVTNQELRAAIDSVNNSLVNKIVLQTKEKELTESAQTSAEKKMEVLNAEDELNKQIEITLRKSTKARQIYDEMVDMGVSKQIAVEQLLSEIMSGKVSGVSRAAEETVNLYNANVKLTEASKAFNAEQQKTNKIEEEKNDIKKRLGMMEPANITTTQTTEKTVNTVYENPDSDKKLEKAREKQLQIMLSTEDKLNQLQLASYKDKYEKERQTRMVAYNKERDDLIAKGMMTADLEKTMRAQLDAELEQMEKDNKTRLAAEILASDKENIQLEMETNELGIKEKYLRDMDLQRAELTNNTVQLLELHQQEADEIFNVKKTALERERALYNDENDKNGAIRQRFLNQIKNLEIAHATSQQANEKAKNQAMAKGRVQDLQHAQSIMGSFASAQASFLQMAGANQSDYAAFSKTIALTSIALDTAEAIASLTANSEANPANAVTFGAAGIAQFAAGIARILANVAAAKNLISSNNTPPSPTFSAGGSAGSGQGMGTVPAFAMGGYNAIKNPGGFYDQPGLFVAAEKGGEWIAPNWMVTDPNYGPIIKALENDRVKKFAMGGNTASSSASTTTASPLNNNSQLLEAMGMLHQAIMSIAPAINDKKVLLSLRDLEMAQNLKTEITTRANL